MRQRKTLRPYTKRGTIGTMKLVHIRMEQEMIDALRKEADRLSAELGMSVTVSDVLRMAARDRLNKSSSEAAK